jgi:BirA family biotin operon repressor/biotin-[acetyl-CoA-carboxylase] ligase
LGGLAVCTALEDTLGLAPQIKWPNDVLLNRHKTCGILAETSWQGAALEAVILGIGINIAPGSVPPAHQVLFPATCVEEFTRQPVDRNALLVAVLEHLDGWRAKLARPEFRQAWESRLAFRDELVEFQFPGEAALVGKLQGVDADGNLRIALESGEEARLAAGDLRLRPIGLEGANHV